MIPSDQFVRFYNEVFKFLYHEQGDEALNDYWLEISRHQELHCLELFKTKDLQGIYDYYFHHIRIEENCDMTIELKKDCLVITMNKCPSLSKALDNDAGAFEKYCDHCPGWFIPLLEKAGLVAEYDIIDRKVPQCVSRIYPKSSGKKSAVLVSNSINVKK